jgi:hypothetical protein
VCAFQITEKVQHDSSLQWHRLYSVRFVSGRAARPLVAVLACAISTVNANTG